MDFPDNHFLLKAFTVVSGPDMVDLTFHNFVSYKENVGKVHWQHLGTGLTLGTAWPSTESSAWAKGLRCTCDRALCSPGLG